MTEMPEMPEMNARRDARFVDDLLDSALAQYAQAEPRPGLEGRLLARLRSEPEPVAFSWRWLPMAAVAAAVLAAVLYFAGGRTSRPPEVAGQPKPAVAPTVAVTPLAPEPSAPMTSRAAGKQPSAPRASIQAAAASTSRSGRREQFPTPEALSEQEQLLVRFVNQAPPRELQVLARENRAEPIKALHVEALDIPPVVVGEAESQ